MTTATSMATATTTTTMTKTAQPRSSKRPATGAPGVKMLITAGALALTMLGWATLTAKERVAAMTPPPVVASVSAPPPAFALDLPPIPTLVPPVQPAPVIANPQPSVGVAQSAPPLRSVSMPMTVSQSSR